VTAVDGTTIGAASVSAYREPASAPQSKESSPGYSASVGGTSNAFRMLTGRQSEPAFRKINIAPRCPP
jgi:hypothetical protein